MGLMMPKTVVSLAIWIFMFGLGVGVAGLLLFIAYQGQVNALEGRMIESQDRLAKKVNGRLDALEQSGPAPAPSASLNVSGTASERLRNDLIRSSAPAIVGISGMDNAGKATSGSGFVVNTTDTDSWVITNYSLVAGAAPGSGTVSVRLANSEVFGQVYEVDPGADLALVVVNTAATRSLRFTRGELKPGDPVWVLGYSRSNPYATAVEAKLVDYGPARVSIDADPATAFNGGPVVDSTGRVVGVLSSKASKSQGKTPAGPVAGTRSATPIKLACNIVLRCPGSPRPGISPSASAGPPATPTPSPTVSPAPVTPPEPPPVTVPGAEPPLP